MQLRIQALKSRHFFERLYYATDYAISTLVTVHVKRYDYYRYKRYNFPTIGLPDSMLDATVPSRGNYLDTIVSP